jgi:hypothetical protein
MLLKITCMMYTDVKTVKNISLKCLQNTPLHVTGHINITIILLFYDSIREIMIQTTTAWSLHNYQT